MLALLIFISPIGSETISDPMGEINIFMMSTKMYLQSLNANKTGSVFYSVVDKYYAAIHKSTCHIHLTIVFGLWV